MKNRFLQILGAFASVLFATANSAAEPRVFQSEHYTIRAEVMAEGLAQPWGMAFLPDGALLVTERPGALLIVKEGVISAPVGGVPKVAAIGQGGLLDVALAPDFESSGTIFLSYAEPGPGGQGTAVARARLVRENATARLEDVRVIFSMAKKTRAGQHFGSRLVPRPDGTLFVTTGERGDGDRAQDMFDHAGAVIRINQDGSIPAGNPYADRKKGLPELWSKGHRNPQGAAWDPVTDSLWVVEHGARGGDEVNRPLPGRNYGWPVVAYGRHYSGFKIGIGTAAPGYEQPEYYWDPSIAPSGLAVYDGDMFPAWRGDVLVGALKFQLLARLDRDAAGRIGKEERLFQGAFGRIRDVEVAPDGAVWLITDEDPGAIIRLSRTE
ncbi:MAG: PQQ-dependent sugar dehydrogenase [Notoacmeibacter sp.]|nr:PQQ-dependent sugar dehydrogenase [Notoacmeibacter sp.]